MLKLRFKYGKLLFKDGKLGQNCCRWRVTGYRKVILPEGCTYGAENCPACKSDPILTISNLTFFGDPSVIVAAAVSGYIGVDCGNNPSYLPCRDTTVPFYDGVYIKTVCTSGQEAEVWYEFEDCPDAKGVGNEDALRNKDLRLIFTLVAE